MSNPHDLDICKDVWEGVLWLLAMGGVIDCYVGVKKKFNPNRKSIQTNSNDLIFFMYWFSCNFICQKIDRIDSIAFWFDPCRIFMATFMCIGVLVSVQAPKKIQIRFLLG